MRTPGTADEDRAWRRAVLEAVDARPGERVLDLAAGTGTSSEPFALAGATVVPTDLSLGMLRVGKHRRPALAFVAATATGFVVVKWLLGFIKAHRFTGFALYRIVLGALLLLLMPAGS